MKKTLIIIAFIISLNTFALKLKIVGSTFENTAVKANSFHTIEILGDVYNRSSPEVINIWMARKDSTGNFVDSVFLYTFNIKDMFYPTYRMGKEGYEINIQMPSQYTYGKFYVFCSYNDTPKGAFWITQTVGVYDEILENKKEDAIYYDLNGSLLSSPNGLCIEIIGMNRRKVFIRGN
jgi:hypothetical protein